MPNCGAITALLFLAFIGYQFWRGTVVVSKARRWVGLGALLVDAGTPEEFSLAHIAGAVNIPAPDIARRQAEVGLRTCNVVVYARSRFQSARAAHILRSIGYHSVINVGPMARWGAPFVESWVGDPAPVPVYGTAASPSALRPK
jgi:rhodanese-related sulfurtransferase